MSRITSYFARINIYNIYLYFWRIINIFYNLHSPPQNIASKCASVGMCHEASRALVKSNKVKEAVDCCVALNQWDRAVEIAHEHNMLSVDELLAKYAAHLLEKGKWGRGVSGGGGVTG